MIKTTPFEMVFIIRDRMKHKYWKIGLAIFLGSLQSIMVLGIAWLLSTIVDIVVGVNLELDISSFSLICLLFFVCYLLVYWLAKKVFVFIKRELRINLKEKLFVGLLWPQGQEHRQHSGEVTAKFQQQVDMLEETFVDPLFAILKDSVFIVFSFFAVASQNIEIALGTAIVFFLYLTVTSGIHRKCEKLLNLSVEKTIAENNELISMIEGFGLARGSGAEHFFASRYSHHAAEAANASYQCNLMYNMLALINQNLEIILSLIVIVVGGYMLEVGASISVGDVLGLSQLVVSVVSPISSLGGNIAKVRGTKSLRKNLQMYIEAGERERKEWDVAEEKIPKLQYLSARNVSVSYGEQMILEDVSFIFEAGKKYAIIGESGSGKSTLLKLILKRVEPAQGEMFWNEVPFSSISKRSILRNISYVAQEPTIFRRNVRENIIAGNTSTYQSSKMNLESVLHRSGLRFLRNSQLTDEILSFSALDLSGGEKKRVAYARAIYKECSILILDEVLSSVHEDMAQRIEKDFLQNTSSLVIHVTHRIGQDLINNYDGIYLVEGKVVKCVKSPTELKSDS